MACLKITESFGFYGILTNPIRGYEYLAKADLFKARVIKSNSWSMDKYYYDFLGGISTLKTGRKLFNPPYSKRAVKKKIV